MNTTFLIRTNDEEEAANVLENLQSVVDTDDRILVLQVKGTFAPANSLTTNDELKTLVIKVGNLTF